MAFSLFGTVSPVAECFVIRLFSFFLTLRKMVVAFTPICVGAALGIPEVLVHRARGWAVPVLSLFCP